jgi:hypothetical protein
LTKLGPGRRSVNTGERGPGADVAYEVSTAGLGQSLQHELDNTEFDNGPPITIAATNHVGEVLIYAGEEQEIASCTASTEC